ncbi:hypothetical protein Taro_030244 [Colocasia esculenta]|uniref:Uncharacterized protein n=1 Tax=Colocasia esculenta TaxID=4460 RepID=A0A843VFW0_COLES|nr:hypothetical protein [Colocasia esculenta]
MDQSTVCTKPWLIGGHFNNFLALHEKKGGRRNYSRSMMDFQACVSAAGLEDAGTNTFCKGGVDTPHNGVDTTPQNPRQKAEEMLRLCRHESKNRSTRVVDTDQEQVDTGPRSQNSLFAEWDRRSTQDEGKSTLDLVPRTNWDRRSTPLPGQVDTLRKDCNLRWMIATCHPRAMKHLKRLKEADQVEASVGEDFKEDPKFKSAEHRLGLQESKLLPNLNFYKGVQLKNKVDTTSIPCRHTP